MLIQCLLCLLKLFIQTNRNGEMCLLIFLLRHQSYVNPSLSSYKDNKFHLILNDLNNNKQINRSLNKEQNKIHNKIQIYSIWIAMKNRRQSCARMEHVGGTRQRIISTFHSP